MLICRSKHDSTRSAGRRALAGPSLLVARPALGAGTPDCWSEADEQPTEWFDPIR